ncbi:MAG TPA: TMEM43 family protein [Thermoanaerobaculia bacterium]|nr:TMEM43 family protein [Thermoanaerobaculia bacterium]
MDRPGGSERRVEVSRQSWGSRLRGAVSGVVVGLVLLAVAAVLLFLNEGRAVRRAQALEEGARRVQPLSDPAPAPERDGSLVHTVGRAVAHEVLEDPALGVRAPALKLLRSVEMYQWQEETRSEERAKVGGGTEKVKTTSYTRGWSDSPIDSNRFAEPAGHQNPPFPLTGQEWVASEIRLGGLRLGQALVDQLGRRETLSPDEQTIERARGLLGRPVAVSQDGLYVGARPAAPEIGDLRIAHSVVRPADVSVVAELRGDALETYRTTNRGTIALLEYGTVTAEQMFAAARAGNRRLTWILRFAGFCAFVLGFAAVLRPLRVAVDVIPPLGRLVGAGLGVASLGLAAISTLVVIAAGWMFYRPVLAGVLFALALAVVVWLWRRTRRRSERSSGAEETKVPPLPESPERGGGRP